MARPVKWRRIEHMPAYRHFRPVGQGQSEENILKLEELEAIRLKDLEGLEQEECASRMEISRPTFQRILTVAREKIADSLVNGKSIRVEGGNYTRNICPVKCLDCGRVWDESIERLEEAELDFTCPDCNSKRLACCPLDEAPGAYKAGCHGVCRRQGHGPGQGQGRGFRRGRNGNAGRRP